MKISQFNSAVEQLSSTIVDSDLLKFFVDLGTTGVKAIDGLVNALGSLGTIGLGAGLLASFKGAGIFKTINGDLTLFNKTLIATKDNLRSLETVNSTVYNKHGVFNLEGLTTSATKSVSSFTKLSNAFKAYNGNLSKSTQLQTAYIKAVGNQNSALGNYLAGLNGAKASMSGYIKSLVAAKAASIGLQVASIALNTAITMGVSLAISALVSQISKWIHAQEEARQKSVELTNSYKEQQSSLDSQIEKYKELKETLDKGNLSTDESRSIKEQLLEIQNSLIESYGNEAFNIDLVNGKYKEQLGLLSELSKEKASDYVTENRDVFADAKEALEKIRTYNLGTLTSWSSYAPKTEDQQKLIDYIETYSDLLELVYTGASYGNMSNTSVKLSVKADVENADELMHQLSIDLEKFAKENNIDVSGILENIPGQLRKTWTDELTEYKTIYDEFIKAEIVRNDTLRPLYQQSIQAVEDYNNALSTGEGVEEAKANLDSVQQSVQNATGELEGSQYVFDSIYDGINRDAEAVYNLGQAFESDKTVQEYAEQLRDLTDIDLKAINFEDTVEQPGEKAFTSLMTYLGYTKEQVQDLIDKLVELGYVQGEIGTSAPSNETDISWALSEENSKAIDDFQGKIKDLKGALESLKTGDLKNNDLVDIMQTFPELQNASGDLETAIKSLIDTLLNDLLNLLGSDAPTQLVESLRAIANIADDVDLSPIEKSIAGMSKVSETLKPLNSVFEDFKENTYLSQESIESLQKSFGKLDSFDAFISTVTKAGLTEQELDSALDKIVTDYLDQTDALDSLNVGTAEYVANVLSEVGVSNSLEVVLSRLGLTLDEYARLKAYANEKGIDLCNVTSSEIASILSEIGVTEDAVASFANLALAKENTNIATIDTSGDIKNLSALVKACGGATNALSALADAKMLMERANKGDSGAISQLESLAKLSGTGSVDAWYQSLINKSQNEVDAALKNAGNRNATVNFTAPDYKYTPKKEKKEKQKKQVKETEIDYAQNTIENLKDSYEDLARATSNLEKNGDLTDYYKKHTKAIQDENDALNKLIGTESKVGKNGKTIKGTGLTGARESYEKEYEKALKATGNADKYRDLIENGSLDVTTYKGKLGENLKTALDAYGKIRETDNEIASYEDKIAENNRKIKEDAREQADYKLKEKEHEEEIATSNKEKNEAIDGQIKQLKILRDLELADAKSPEEVSQINNEYDNKINSLKDKKSSNSEDTYKLKQEGLEIDKEEAKNLEEHNKIIEKEKKNRKKIYEQALKQVDTDEEKTRLERDYNEDIKKYDDEIYQNNVKKIQLEQDELENQKELAQNYEERNRLIDRQKSKRTELYNIELAEAKTEEEKAELTRAYNNDMSAYDDEQKKNIQDKLQMQYDSLEAQKDETATVAEKNKIIEQEKFLRERIYLQAIAQAKTEEDRNKLQKEYLADIKTLDKEASDNVTNAKNSYIDLQETIADLLDNDVELRKAMGENITEADYGDLINQQLHIKQLYQQQYDEQLKILDTLEPTSEEWDKTVDLMSNALTKINACDNAILKYNKAMKETPVENIKKGIDALNRLKDEVTDMLGLLDNNSKNGMTAMTLYQKKLSIIEAQIQQNNQAMSLLNANTEEFQELQAENRNLASEQLSIYEELSKIRIDSINEETERMKELVDLKKKENEEEYNKQKLTKKIAKDNESLAKMEAKLQQLRTNNSDGANNKLILELESRLAKKKEELSDEQLEREYEAKQDALDKEYELKEKANQKEIESIENSNDKKEQIAKEMLAGVAYTYEGYFKDVNSMANTYGIKLTDSIKSQWKDRQSAVEEYIAIAKQAVTISSSTPNDYNVGNNGQRDKNIDSFTIGTADANDIKTNLSKKTPSVKEQILNILKNGEGVTAKSDLNKYIISRNYGKKPISYKQMSTLYNLLTGDNTTSKDFKGNMPLINDLLAQLKNAGFSKGGIIERASKIIKGNGDNVLITARTGESILTEEQTKAFMNFKNYTPAFTNVARNLPLNNVQRKSDINVTIPMQFHDCVTNDEMLRQMKGIVYQEANGAINEVLRKM